MDEHMVGTLMSTIELIASTLDTAPDSWRDQLQAIRNITATLELLDDTPNQVRKHWQLPLISVFQRVAYADADNGGVLDIANWCLRQMLRLLLVHPDDVDLLALVGWNWLLRSQKFLARIHCAEWESVSSETSQIHSLSQSEEQRQAITAAVQAEDRLQTADYVEARGTLLPAVDYLRRATAVAQAQEKITGLLLSNTAEACMSLGNVSSPRINHKYFTEALAYLRVASDIPNYSLPLHLQQYLEEYGPLESRD
ncbi:hypothetical protein K504DRAFT_440449 [Pleomassaria siparia CBS 279.74]|uniref:Uncharacterized protein n=1 Tax=Pleomassaria siparia CBS 279.74 TaxID=1314801 RepID=A0A6G1JXW9_9PLEO|nr:hypothetical protein K504DRAFT_440449 [Pleomassaria siparia CBS 279.74]